ncbi:MAG TPA: 4Fe-4S ferredoxin, partial [Hymenobacter sp.]
MSPTLATPPLPTTPPAEKVALAGVAAGLLALLLALADADPGRQQTWLYLAVGLVSAGTLAWSWLAFGRHPAGVQQNNLWLRASTGRGSMAWVTGLVLTGFYVVLYWYSSKDGQGNFGLLNNLVHGLDGFSQWLRARPADQWFLYGTFYTLAILLMGGRALWKYRHSRYQLIRTASVMFFQTGFAFIIPGVLQFFQQPE